MPLKLFALSKMDGDASPTNQPNISNAGTLPLKISNKRKRRDIQKQSEVWNHFTILETKLGETSKCACNYCKKKYVYDPIKLGTTSLWTHLDNQCKRYSLRTQDKNQTTLDFKPKKEDEGSSDQLMSWSFSQRACRRAVAEMIIIDKLPFRHVENEGFKRLLHAAQPAFKIPSRVTVAKDCLNIYVEEKKYLKCILKDQRVCLTIDVLTSVQNLNYMCVTAHYIDSAWKLQKKILNFCLVPNHKGKTLGKIVEMCLLEWEIDKILTVTIDNASSNDLCIEYLKRKTKDRRETILEHEYLHMRCCSHIISLIVCDGLKDNDDLILKVRKAVKYVKSSPSRMAKFKRCAKMEFIECKSQVCLDVSTRWDSTYLMLERAIQFQKAFERLEEDDENFIAFFRDDDGKGNGGNGSRPPDNEDWEKVRLFVKFLKLFYNATLHFSGSLYVTTNTSYNEILAVQHAIARLCKNQDVSLRLMAESMRSKFDKYWGNLDRVNLLMLFALILDPRYKLKYVKFCFQTFCDVKIVDGLIKKVKDSLIRFYDWYVEHNSSNSAQHNNAGELSKVVNVDEDEGEDENDAGAMLISKYKRHLVEEESLRSKSELNRYLLESCVDDSPSSNFDILNWWRDNSFRFSILSLVARDVLAIQVSTVASESAFSIGGRALDPFRSSMSVCTVEALVCCQNWLRTSSTHISIRDALDEMEEYEKLESDLGLVTISDG